MKSKGIALILTLSILTGLIALALGIATLLAREIKLSQEIANSVLAYGAADTGIERFMYGLNKESLNPTNCCCAGAGCAAEKTVDCYPTTELSNGASYKVCTKKTAPPVEIKSTGTYKGTNRSVQISY